MRKSLFLLVLVALAGWFSWRLLRIRQREFAGGDGAGGPYLHPHPLPPDSPQPPSPPPGPPHIEHGAPEVPSNSPTLDVQRPDLLDALALRRPLPRPAEEEADAEQSDEQVDETPEEEILMEQAVGDSAGAVPSKTGSSREGSAPPKDQSADGEVVGYCMRCKTKRTMVDPQEELTENGRRGARGMCPVCGAKIFTFLPDNERRP